MADVFEVLREDPGGARLGRLNTAHGAIDTPVFLPVGTAGAGQGLTQEALEELGAQILLAHTHHLYLPPGPALIPAFGRLHQFVARPRPDPTAFVRYPVF